MKNINSVEQTAQSVPYLYVWNDNFKRAIEDNFTTSETSLIMQNLLSIPLSLLYSTYFLALIQLTLLWLNIK